MSHLPLPECLPEGCRWAESGETVEAYWLSKVGSGIRRVVDWRTYPVGQLANTYLDHVFIVPDKPRTRLEWMVLGVLEDVYADCGDS